MKKTFRVHWKDGTSEIMIGTSIASAFATAGYGNGAIAAVDYYEEVIFVVLITENSGTTIEELKNPEDRVMKLGTVVHISRENRRVVVILEDGERKLILLGNPAQCFSVEGQSDCMCKVFGLYSDAEDWKADQMGHD